MIILVPMFRMPDYSGPVRQQFEDQFEREGDAFLYRRNLRYAPVRVTAGEREAFVEDFARAMRRLQWATIAGLILLTLGLAAFLTWQDREFSALPLYVGLGVIVVLNMLLWYRAWKAPSRTLERRPTLGAPRSRAETGRLMLQRVSWGQLLMSFLLAPFAAFRFLEESASGWKWFWLTMAVFFVIIVPVQAWRKWRLERRLK
jgi:hypothetical protein